ncbi:hypothetical protein KPL74_11065 [Bacillus sp. NP157]|nr:hypothetical protein KPL74_11065 [Bacillus sp. NP157]
MNYARSTLENAALKLGYDLSPASDRDRMAAASNGCGEPMPRWTLNPVGNQWASDIIRCENLAAVADELDGIAIAIGQQG